MSEEKETCLHENCNSDGWCSECETDQSALIEDVVYKDFENFNEH